MKNAVKQLLAFIHASPTPFHATQNIRIALENAGYKALDEKERWELKPGGMYFVSRNDSALIAFCCGRKKPWESGFCMMGAHTDSPTLRLKPKAEQRKDGMASVRVEACGGPIHATWLDRELALAGRVYFKRRERMEMALINITRPVAVIPNAAIHLNREVNKGFDYNPQTHLSAILMAGPEGTSGKKAAKADSSPLLGLIASELRLAPSEVLDVDLYFYDAMPGSVAGASQDFIVSPRLDNLAMCHAIRCALENVTMTDHTSIGFFFDSEDTGSRTYQGADSSFAQTVLERLVLAYKGDREGFHRAMALTFFVSADMAHALHPNFADKHDPSYAPLLNGGPVIKQNGSNRYATTAESSALFEALCRRVGVTPQKFANRSDMPCGTTIGPILSSDLGVLAVDIGNPLWAMHSVRETAGARDHEVMIKVLQEYVSQGIR